MKPVASIISLFKGIGLNIVDENDYVDKIFAESVWLVFHPKTKDMPSFEINSDLKDSKTENNTEKYIGEKEFESLDNNYIKTEKSFRLCPYCSSNLKISNYDSHILQKCPKLNRNSSTDSSKRQKVQSLSNISIEKENNGIDKLKVTSYNKINIEKIHWELLPQGEWHYTELQNYFRHLSSTKKWKNKHFDEARLFKIEKNLKPSKCFVGKNEFDGYVVYCFDWTQNVILECPIYGNAIYIIKQGKSTWQEIAKVSKWEARTEYAKQVTVINHNETWLERLEQNLRCGV